MRPPARPKPLSKTFGPQLSSNKIKKITSPVEARFFWRFLFPLHLLAKIHIGAAGRVDPPNSFLKINRAGTSAFCPWANAPTATPLFLHKRQDPTNPLRDPSTQSHLCWIAVHFLGMATTLSQSHGTKTDVVKNTAKTPQPGLGSTRS